MVTTSVSDSDVLCCSILKLGNQLFRLIFFVVCRRLYWQTLQW